MIEDGGVVFTNINGQSWTFNTTTCPLKEFIPETDMVTDEVKRMQEPGIWPARTISGKLLIHITGDILRDTSADYITDRIKMLNILVPGGVVNQERYQGIIAVQFVGMEWMQNKCCLDAFPSMPMQALYPSVSEFQMTFKVFDGYMIGSSSGKKYSI